LQEVSPKIQRRRWAGVAVLAVAVGLGVLVLAGSGSDDRDEPDPGDPGLVAALPEAEPAPQPPPEEELPATPGAAKKRDDAWQRAAEGPGPDRPYEIVSVRLNRKVDLWDEPGGSVVAVLKDRTEFGSIRSHWVVRRRGGWLGVPAAQIPNGRLGWIKDNPDKLEYEATRYGIEADLSERVVRLYRGRKIVRSFPVTVGAPDSPTPPGRYAVTDGLTVEGPRDFYGCCVLALTGHQPNLPPGWIGGDRIAIHGTPGAIGGASSSGCLRASDADMRALFATVPLGAPVRIRP
jgi:hypothetical protein